MPQGCALEDVPITMGRVFEMSDEKEIEEMRKKRAAALLAAHEQGEAPPDVLPWSFRFNINSGFHEIVQEGNMIAVTQDANWANMVCDMLNRLTLAQQVMGEPE